MIADDLAIGQARYAPSRQHESHRASAQPCTIAVLDYRCRNSASSAVGVDAGKAGSKLCRSARCHGSQFFPDAVASTRLIHSRRLVRRYRSCAPECWFVTGSRSWYDDTGWRWRHDAAGVVADATPVGDHRCRSSSRPRVAAAAATYRRGRSPDCPFQQRQWRRVFGG